MYVEVCYVCALVFVSTCASVHAESTGRGRAVVLNLWVVPNLRSNDPFTEVTYDRPTYRIFKSRLGTVAELQLRGSEKDDFVAEGHVTTAWGPYERVAA